MRFHFAPHPTVYAASSRSVYQVAAVVQLLSRVGLFVTAWTVAYQAPLYENPWDFPGNSTEVDCHFLLQGIFPTQGSNPGLPHCRQTLYRLRAKAVNGTIKSRNTEIISAAVGRQVKMVGVDTMMQNALRDGAEWAWIPRGDTCAFCIALASRGWQRASKEAIKDGHAEHIHANCDCTYAVRFSHNLDVEGYSPSAYYKMYYGDGKGSPDDKIRALRRRIYAENADEINAQKRSAYAKRQERESSAAEELNIGN